MMTIIIMVMIMIIFMMMMMMIIIIIIIIIIVMMMMMIIIIVTAAAERCFSTGRCRAAPATVRRSPPSPLARRLAARWRESHSLWLDRRSSELAVLSPADPRALGVGLLSIYSSLFFHGLQEHTFW